MNTLEFFQSVYVAERNLKPESERQLRMSLQMFADYCNCDPPLDELSHAVLNQWSTSVDGWSPRTAKRRVMDVLSVWSYAYAIEATDNKPNRLRVRLPRTPKRIPDAWTLDELGSILEACEQFQVYLPNGVMRGDMLRATIEVGYYSALRANDLFELRRDQLCEHGAPVPQEKKNGDEVLVVTPKYVIDFINRRYPSTVDKVVCWPYRREHFYNGAWKPMLRQAGLTADSRNGLQKLRRTAVSYGESIQQGFGAKLAGHTPGSRTTYASYVDPRIIIINEHRQLPRPGTG